MPVGSNRVQKTNARFVAATNQNIEKLILDGQFREDLYFRLNVMPIFIPPLKERKEDIQSLVEHFLKKYNQSLDVPKTFSTEALKALQAYNWPGNIRELENIIQRSVILTSNSLIDLSDLAPEIQNSLTKESSDGLDFEKFKIESEKSFIEKALRANQGKINRTVAQANIPKNTLLRKNKKIRN